MLQSTISSINHLTKITILCLISLTTIIQFQSCYTVVKHTDTHSVAESYSKTDSLTADICIVEGIVRYEKGGGGTRENSSSPRGYFLYNFFWVRNAPPYNITSVALYDPLSLDYALIKPYLNKYVRIIGTWDDPFPDNSVKPIKPIGILVKVSKIEIIKN